MNGMKMTMRDCSRVPYGGRFDLKLPDLGMVGTGSSFHQLKESVEAYRRANGIPIGLGFLEELEQAVCASYPNECQASFPEAAPKPQNLDWKAILPGLIRLTALKAQGAALVSDEEANRRAAICARCPWKSEVKLPCPGLCGEVERLVKGIIGSRITTSNSAIEKKSCGVCRCFLTSAVYVDLKAQQAILSEEEKAGFREVAKHTPCWKADGLSDQ